MIVVRRNKQEQKENEIDATWLLKTKDVLWWQYIYKRSNIIGPNLFASPLDTNFVKRVVVECR